MRRRVCASFPTIQPFLDLVCAPPLSLSECSLSLPAGERVSGPDVTVPLPQGDSATANVLAHFGQNSSHVSGGSCRGTFSQMSPNFNQPPGAQAGLGSTGASACPNLDWFRLAAHLCAHLLILASSLQLLLPRFVDSEKMKRKKKRKKREGKKDRKGVCKIGGKWYKWGIASWHTLRCSGGPLMQ